MTENRFKTSLFVGRFEPPHLGHEDCLEHALSESDSVVIVIGSINVIDELTNPWTFEQRRKMWEAVIAGRGWEERVRIIGSNDYVDNDEKWAREILEQALDAEAVYGHNDWTNDTLHKFGKLVVVEPGLLRRAELEGTKIRKMMREGDEAWRLLVSEEVAREIDVISV